MNDSIELPEAMLLVARYREGVFLVKSKNSGLWTFPGGPVGESFTDITQFARSFFYEYLKNPTVEHLRHVLTPPEKMLFGDSWLRCSVFKCQISGAMVREQGDSVWIAPSWAIVAQALTPDTRSLLSSQEVSQCLLGHKSKSHLEC